MWKKTLFLTKSETNFVKSVAIIMMMVHHFLGFPSWRVGGIALEPSIFLTNGIPLSQTIAVQFKICVSVFAVITGYGWGNGKVSLRKSLQRIGKIGLIYEICLVFEYSLNALIAPSFVSIGDIFDQITLCFFHGSLLIGFAWYIQFFVLAAISYPVLVKLMRACTNKLIQGMIAIIPFWGVYILLERVGILGIWNGIIVGYLIYMPCIMMGTWIADNANRIWRNDKPSIVYSICWTALSIAVLFIRYTTGGRLYFDVFLAPIFIYALSNLFVASGLAHCKLSFGLLSTCSTYMWLLHSIFFQTPGARQFQIVLYCSRKAIIVCLWGCFIVFVVAYILSFMIEKVYIFGSCLKAPHALRGNNSED